MTVKTLGFMPRRRDLDRRAFRDHYEQRHAPLAEPLFPFRRYRRNHLVDQTIEPAFDGVSEFWVDATDRIAELMAGEVGDVMRSDERNFLDQPAIAAVNAEEVLTEGDAGTTLLLLKREGGERDALVQACRHAGASLDLLSPMDQRASPFDAMIRLVREEPALPPGWRLALRLDVEPIESDPARLMG